MRGVRTVRNQPIKLKIAQGSSVEYEFMPVNQWAAIVTGCNTVTMIDRDRELSNERERARWV